MSTNIASFYQTLNFIAIGLFITLLLASYYFCYLHRRRRHLAQHSNDDHPNQHTIYLPRILFVAENESQNDVVVGLDETVIDSYPKFVYSKMKGVVGNDVVCSICLCEYREPEVLRMLPDCGHCFHVMCVDTWLKFNASCPVCRNSPLPTPMSTPLQEVVPLSQYSAGGRSQ